MISRTIFIITTSMCEYDYVYNLIYIQSLNLKVLDKINVINTGNNVIEQEITVEKGPTSIAYDPVHQRMYVTIFGWEDPDGIKDEINTICI